MKELASPLEPELVRIAAFSDGQQGGNPAGVWLGSRLPAAEEMQRIAAQVGFSETAFAAPLSPLGPPGSPRGAATARQTAESGEWRVRYFSPEAEVPFCGHATIALGVALARRFGEGEYALHLNQTEIKVSGWQDEEGQWQAALQSPPTRKQAGPGRVGECRADAVWLHVSRSGSPHSAGTYPWRRRSSGAGPEQSGCALGHALRTGEGANPDAKGRAGHHTAGSCRPGSVVSYPQPLRLWRRL